MTTRYWYQDDLDTNEVTAVRLAPEHRGGGWPATSKLGQAASGRIMVDDPFGALTFIPWRRWWVTDDELPGSTPSPPVGRPDDPLQRIWTGYITEAKIRRGDEFTGAGRVWDLTLLELNSILQHRVFREADDFDRPAETDIERLSAYLATSWANGIIFTDLGFIDTSDPVDLDPNDYTGHHHNELFEDLSNASGKNHFLVFHAEEDHRDLFYARPEADYYPSTLRISNVAADIDEDVTWGPLDDTDAELTIDPSRVFAGIWMPYSGGAVYRTRVAEDGEVWRDGVAPAVEVKEESTANALADRELAEIAEPDENISVDLWLPQTHINRILPGQLIDVRFSHLPGYESFRTTRIHEHVIRQDRPQQTDDNYHLSLVVSPLAIPPTLTRLIVLVGHSRGSDFSVDPPNANNDSVPTTWSAVFPSQLDLTAGGGSGGKTQVWYASIPAGSTGLKWASGQAATSMFFAFEVEGISSEPEDSNWGEDEATYNGFGDSGDAVVAGDAFLVAGVMTGGTELRGPHLVFAAPAGWTERFELLSEGGTPGSVYGPPQNQVATQVAAAGTYSYNPAFSVGNKNLAYIVAFPGTSISLIQSASAGGGVVGFSTLTFGSPTG